MSNTKVCAIETKVIKVNRSCPLYFFRKLHRLAYFTELMDRNAEGKVIWDDKRESIYSEQAADAEWQTITTTSRHLFVRTLTNVWLRRRN
jgi:hypothetical protein